MESKDGRSLRERHGGTGRQVRPISTHAVEKPLGGFCFVPAMALIAAWWAYKQGIIQLADLRVWFASFEAVASRRAAGGRRRALFTDGELAATSKQTAVQVRSALRRLEKAGLLRWSQTALDHGLRLGQLDAAQREDLQRWADRIENRRRKVPVPRRTMRYLAASTRPVTIATMLGHLLRCLYYRDGRCDPTGRCKSTWIATRFGVDVRNVKAARKALVGIGWLIVEPTGQVELNRWGPRLRVNLAWSNRDLPGTEPAPPLRAGIIAESPPPKENRNLATRLENQERASQRGPGADAPTMRRLNLRDLHEPRRLRLLHAEASAAGLVPAGEAGKLAFFSAAARALRVGDRNPCGLFATLVRRGLWHFGTLDDEDRARAWLRTLRAAEMPNRIACVSVGPSAVTVPARGSKPEAVARIIARMLGPSTRQRPPVRSQPAQPHDTAYCREEQA